MILTSTLMFGGCFLIKDIYRKIRNIGEMEMTFESMLIGSSAGLIVLFAINGFKLQLTLFTFIMALISMINSFAFTYFSFKALGKINLSLFSLFSMLGGMLIPFVQGLIFYNEPITIAKILCVIFIIVSLLITIVKKEDKKGLIYYIGVFILNGMSGVISNIFSKSSFPKTSAADFSICCTLINIIVSGIALIIVFKNKTHDNKLTFKAGLITGVSGVLDKIANYLLVFALVYVDSSIQYPMVTGGVIIVSTLACFLTDKKPSKKDLVSVLLAFIGMIILFAVPI